VLSLRSPGLQFYCCLSYPQLCCQILYHGYADNKKLISHGHTFWALYLRWRLQLELCHPPQSWQIFLFQILHLELLTGFCSDYQESCWELSTAIISCFSAIQISVIACLYHYNSLLAWLPTNLSSASTTDVEGCSPSYSNPHSILRFHPLLARSLCGSSYWIQNLSSLLLLFPVVQWPLHPWQDYTVAFCLYFQTKNSVQLKYFKLIFTSPFLKTCIWCLFRMIHKGPISLPYIFLPTCFSIREHLACMNIRAWVRL